MDATLPGKSFGKPPAWLLILLNAGFWLVFLAVVATPYDPLAAIFWLVALVFVVGVSTVGQVVIWLVIRRRTLHWLLRTALFFLPTAVLVLWGLFGPKPSPKQNQIQPLVSPSGKYVLTLPIDVNPNYHHLRVWKVTIAKPDGTVLYRDDSSKFGGTFNVYWLWDSADRVWLYNSDDGAEFYWEFDGTKWNKTSWEKQSQKDPTIKPPENLIPY